MPRYDLICLDYDGTLVHTVPAITATLGEIFPQYGLQPPEEDAVRKVVGMGIRETFTLLHPGFKEEDLTEAIESYRSVYSKYEKTDALLFPGILETIEKLAAAGHKMAVVSNKGLSVLKESAERFGLMPHLVGVFGDHPDYARKPDPKVWEQDVAPAFPGLTPDRALMVGDAYPDMAFSRAVGMDACFAGWGYGDKEKCMELNPKHTIEAFSELAGILE